MFYAFSILVIVVGITMVGDMLFRFGLGQFMFSPFFAIVVFIVAYLAAPYLAKRVRQGP